MTIGKADPPPLARRAASAGASPVLEILALTARPEVISFAGGMPAPELFDAEGIRAAHDRVLTEEPQRVLQYSTTEGDPLLREVIAARMSARGLTSRTEDVVVTTGSQQALTLVSTVLLEPGDVVLVENPTYLAALEGFAFAGVRIAPVPGDDEGIDPGALSDLVVRERPKMLYLVPNFQNPTGRTLSLERRHAVADIAGRHGLWIVEDDPYGELRFGGLPVPWIASLDAADDRTVLLGSLSKIMAPGMRLGWLRTPSALRPALVFAKQAADLHSSTVGQAAAARYLSDSDLDAHLERTRAAYRARRDALLDGLPSALPDGSIWNRPEGGMFTWVTLPERYDSAALLAEAVGHGVAYVPGAPFFAGSVRSSALRMSFTGNTEEGIREGLLRLAKVFA
ncbi:PLP-dependent aminotransferase family protein [Actinacidiphila glaucinigra]|uniref:aminotransferase-like domain-containing protein n=1 Tax=Actinacidiphila glaucinigra TaxID=235986 RepID=UPI003D8DEDCA